MFTRQVFCAILSLSLFLGFCSSETAKAQTQEEDELKELTNRIRRDKFDLILPQVMREHNIDMWIHVIREGDTDFFGAEDLGSYSGVFIFTDRGGDRIERAVLGRRWKNSRRNQPPGLRVSDHTLVEESGAYDIIGEAIEQREIKGDPYTVYDFRFVGIGALDIGTFVDERNPKRIALNYLENLGPHVGGRSYDGISYTDYRLLVKAIGEKYAKRLISSEYLIADYLSRPVESELVMYKKIRQWIEESMERDFAKIVPGVTKAGDLEGEVALMRPGRSRIPDDYVFQGGDLFLIDHGAEGYYDLREEGSGYWGLWQVYNIPWKFGNFFELKVEYGYVLREGEIDLPPELKRLWSDAMKIRQITADNIKIGRTGRETFEIITQELTEAGFNVNAVQKFHKDQDPEKTQVSIDLHALGKGRNAPRIGSIGPDWEHEIPLPLYHHFMMEFFIYRASPSERNGAKYLSLWFHDGAIVTERGVEYLSPPPKEIHLIK